MGSKIKDHSDTALVGLALMQIQILIEEHQLITKGSVKKIDTYVSNTCCCHMTTRKNTVQLEFLYKLSNTGTNQ